MVYLVVAIFIALDFFTGVIKALKEKTYNSKNMREGLYHKCGSVLCVAFGYLVDYAQGIIELGVALPVANAICVYIILMECSSVIENIAMINPNIVPSVIKGYLGKLNGGVKE